jgi:mRNA-degrading endonuclease RelE of RelBE toxin-antitoxin system
MIRYTVVWAPEPQNELAELWLVASDRAAVAQAADEIDDRLATSPISKGVELSEGLRRFRYAPLQVLYVVRTDDRVVEVTAVKRIG